MSRDWFGIKFKISVKCISPWWSCNLWGTRSYSCGDAFLTKWKSQLPFFFVSGRRHSVNSASKSLLAWNNREVSSPVALYGYTLKRMHWRHALVWCLLSLLHSVVTLLNMSKPFSWTFVFIKGGPQQCNGGKMKAVFWGLTRDQKCSGVSIDTLPH